MKIKIWISKQTFLEISAAIEHGQFSLACRQYLYAIGLEVEGTDVFSIADSTDGCFVLSIDRLNSLETQ